VPRISSNAKDVEKVRKKRTRAKIDLLALENWWGFVNVLGVLFFIVFSCTRPAEFLD
jgi:Fe2+ transport system protein B